MPGINGGAVGVRLACTAWRPGRRQASQAQTSQAPQRWRDGVGAGGGGGGCPPPPGPRDNPAFQAGGRGEQGEEGRVPGLCDI